MVKTSRLLVLSAVLAVLFALAATAAPQKAEDVVKDPVCGMSFNKSEAKATFELKGTTYYFCAFGCKDKFAQDPEKYLQKKVEKIEKIEKVVKIEKAACTCPHCQAAMSEKSGKSPMCGKEMVKPEMAKGQGCPMMQGKMTMEPGKHGEAMSMAHCPMAGLMHAKDVELKMENTKDGVQITLSSKDTEMVKKIQEMTAKMKAGCDPKTCAEDCIDK